MVCSSCGYDNPREHRYCGMCGTPFPHRPLTVPDAQSTLTFTSKPFEIASSALPVHVAEPLAAEPLPAGVAPEPPAPIAEAVETEPVGPAVESPVTKPAEAEPVEIIALAPPTIDHHEVERPEVIEALPPTPEKPEPIAEIPEPVTQVHEELAPPAHIEEPPTPPETHAPVPPGPHLVVRPAPPRRESQPVRTDAGTRTPAAAHPSPDSLPVTSPPASAGMPTFQEIVEASGAPDISPFEPPTEKHPDEDRELQEYIASFRYTPPKETADELTMRSEVPVIDKEAPAVFHHASFDDDVPPPPEAGPHPTGEEYYPPVGSAERSRFLEISDTQHAAHPQHTSTGTSFLGLEDSAPNPLPIDEAAPPVRRQSVLWWWSLLALLAVFGGLGYLEGRAQVTHAFRGPVEIVRNQYNNLRQRFAQISAPPPAVAPETKATEEARKPEPPEQSPANAPPAAANPQPDGSAKPSSPAAEPTNSPAQSQQTPPQTASPSVASTAGTEAKTETAKAGPAKPIEAPPPKPSSKPQPGQQELNKAIDASDPTAAAAWLWKSTSRGNPEAPIRLADMYIKGKGVPKSCEQALVLLRSAAIKENAPARNRLAALYANGTCVVRDRVKAYQLMSSALVADPTSEWAQQNRDELWNQMTPTERAEAQKYR